MASLKSALTQSSYWTNDFIYIAGGKTGGAFTYGDASLGRLDEGCINYLFEVDDLGAPLNCIASDDKLWFAIYDSLSKRFCRETSEDNLKEMDKKKKQKNGVSVVGRRRHMWEEDEKGSTE